MATVVQGVTNLTNGVSVVYVNGAACVFQGFIAGTLCAIVKWQSVRTMDVVAVSSITTTPTG